MNTPIQNEPNQLQQKLIVPKRSKVWIIGAAVAIIALSITGAVLFMYVTAPTPTQPLAEKSVLPNTAPTPTPDPFQDLTIPYLRERDYSSSLAKLDKVSENANYTSYLTSYDSDGLTINGQVTKPVGEMPIGGWPATIFIHGYIVPQRYQTLVNYAQYVDYLARNGFVVFKIDLRGHAKSEGEPSGTYYSSDYVIDTLNAYAALQSADFVNPQRIGLWGHSMSGNVAMRSFVAKSDIPAVVIWAGAVYSYVDFGEYGISDNSYQPQPADSPSVRKRQELFEAHGQFDPDDAFWRQIVPTNYLTGLTGAVQVHHATDDPVVSIAYSRNLMKLLDATAIVHQLHEYPSGGHSITGTSFTKAMEQTVAFFTTHLNATQTTP